MRITELALPGIKVIEPAYLTDNRGYAAETYSRKDLEAYGITTEFVIDYECSNILCGTVRGIHFQANPYAQVKLVRVLQGEILDFAVDLRKDSPTYKKWISLVLSSENQRQLYLPSGYGHAYITRQPNTIVHYKFSNYYHAEFARSIRWDDPDIGLMWGGDAVAISEKDRNAPMLTECDINLTVKEN